MASNFPSHARHPREEHHIRLSKRPPFDPSSYRHALPKTANAGSAAPPIRHVHRPARILKACSPASLLTLRVSDFWQYSCRSEEQDVSPILSHIRQVPNHQTVPSCPHNMPGAWRQKATYRIVLDDSETHI